MTDAQPLTLAAHGLQITPDDAAAKALGFAGFNRNPHLCVEVPNGGFTLSCRLGDGTRVTFAFVATRSGDVPAGCVDIQLHDETRRHPARPDLPVFDMIGFGPGPTVFDTRKIEDKPMTLATVLLANDGD